MNYQFASRMDDLNGTATREIFKLLSRPEIISFAGGLPATEAIPHKLLAELADDIMHSSAAESVLQYGTTEGSPELRQIFTDYLATLGVPCSPDCVLPVSGGQQGIDLMCKVFLNPDDVDLVEDPTYLAVLQIIKSYQGRCVGVAPSFDGIDIEDLENKIIQLKPKMLYLVPTFANPTGKTMTVANRKEIARLTAKYNVIVLEDDPYASLRYDGIAVPPLKSFDVSGNIVYLTSFSKLISPGLRTGVITAHEKIVRKLAIGKQGTDLHSSQLALALVGEILQRGLIGDIVQNAIGIYRQRRDAMLQALDTFMPAEFCHSNPQGGLFVWGWFEGVNINCAKLLPEAVQSNVAYIPGNTFFADNSGKEFLRLSFSSTTPDKILEGIRLLGEFFQAIIDQKTKPKEDAQ